MSGTHVLPPASGSGDNPFIGLEPMLLKFTHQTWKRIPASHRRHIDFEDVHQEIRIKAWEGMQKYDPSKGTKLSTWVMNTLKRRSREINAPYTDPARNKKRKGVVLSLDRPQQGDSCNDCLDAWERPDLRERADRIQSALSSFERGYRSSCDEVQQILLDALGFRVKLDMGSKHTRRVALNVAVRCQLSGDDIRVLRKIEPERTLMVAQRYSSNQPKIECRQCGSLYPVSEVGHSIDARTLLCKNCCTSLADGDATCYAKAYDPDTLECSAWCPVKTSCAERTKEMGNIKLVKGKGLPNIKLNSLPLQVEAEDEDEDIDGMSGDEEETNEIYDEDDEVPKDRITMTRISGRAAKPVKAKKNNPSTGAEDIDQQVQTELDENEGVRRPAKGTKVPAKATKKPVPKAIKKPVKAAPHTAAKAAKGASKATRGGSEAGRTMKEFKPHYWTAVSPFRPGSKLQRVVDKLEKAGTVKLTQLKAYTDKLGMNWRGVLNNLRKQTSYNEAWRWKFKEDGAGKVSFEFTHRPSKAYVKQAGEPVRADAVALKKIRRAA